MPHRRKPSGLKQLKVVARCALVAFSALFLPAAHADVIAVGGTGAGIGTMQRLGEAFSKLHGAHSVRVLPSLGTSGGIQALLKQRLDIAVASRELVAAEAAGGLVATKYGTTALVFAGHRDTPAMSLTLGDIADIYSGEIRRWPDGKPLRLVLRPRKDTDSALLEGMSPAIATAVALAHDKRGMNIAITDTDAANELEKIPGAFGTTTLAVILSENRKVNMLSFEGVRPGEQTLRDGHYPLLKDMYVVTAAQSSDATRQFLEFIASPGGQRILRATGHRTD